MGAEVEVCDECAHNCLLIHKKNHPSQAQPPVSSFFKVMIGDRFSEALFVPPRFAGKIASLLDKETYLEDSTGRRWTVMLSNVDGCLAIREGWNDFSSDHNIQLGDFLVFHYIAGHFVVQVYGRNGCQKLQYSEEGKCVQNKRTKFSDHLVTANRHCDPLEKESKRKQQVVDSNPFHSNIHVIRNNLDETIMVAENVSNCRNNNERFQIAPTTDLCDEPYIMLNRDVGFSGQDDRNSLFDLFDFEMSNSKLGPEQIDIVQPEGNGCAADPLMKDQTGTGSIKGDPMIVERDENGSLGVHDAKVNGEYNYKMHLKSNDDVNKNRFISVKDVNKAIRTSPSVDSQINDYAVDKALYRTEHVDIPSECTRKAQVAEGKTPSTAQIDESLMLERDYAPTANNSQQKLFPESSKSPLATGKTLMMVKEEQAEFVLDQQCGEVPSTIEVDPLKNSTPVNESRKMVKAELTDGTDFPSRLAPEISCLVTTDSMSFLELPTDFPTYVARGRPRLEQKQQVVILRDPSMRLWPVLYHERHGFKVFTDGWSAFRKANNIKPGDACCFSPETESDGTYIVQFISK